MNGTNAKTACMTGCWLMAGAIGLVILVMMSVLSGMSLGASLFGAAIVTAVLGMLLTWILCRPVEEAIVPAATTNVARSGTAGTSARTAPTGAVAPASDAAAVVTPPVTAAAAAKPAVTEPAVTPAVTVSAAKPAVAAPAVTEPAITKPAVTQPVVTAAAKPKPAKPKSDAVSASTAAGLAANGGAAPVTPAAAPQSAAASGVPASFAALDDAAVASAGAGQKPAGLTAPRDGRADDLKLIEGIGPVLEQRLHDWGIYHFDQISAWGAAEVAFADQNVPRFKGRASRDKWVAQARIIVAEGIPAFLERAKTNDY